MFASLSVTTDVIQSYLYNVLVCADSKTSRGHPQVTAENGMTWDGPTPTAPWTAACKKSPSTGTRVSGPLGTGSSIIVRDRTIRLLVGFSSPAWILHETILVRSPHVPPSSSHPPFLVLWLLGSYHVEADREPTEL
ncbi:hypothetical protein BC936DRAFT_150156 [Jimgerdemannia flammicorona]|uniref:Uncharacterized protein n=1 Tax=Jimgerdemannia flammicorona TaxID=994334 RepID=A0A433DJS5_9FUNG|nr:hypothetical protein BC936DRAFT_150156 [Jimgerdemannia flammicorona]